MQCTSDNAAGCCNYYDNNRCVIQCGSNKHPDENFDCVCDMFYIGSQCDSKWYGWMDREMDKLIGEWTNRMIRIT